jgi:hypothetical protein
VVESVVEFEVNTSIESNEIQLLDATEEHVLVLVNSSDFSMSTGFSFQDSEAMSCIVVCDPSLNVHWSISSREAALRDAVVGSDGIYVFSEGSGELLFPNSQVQLERTTWVGKLDFEGNVVWGREYSGLWRGWSPHRSLALTGVDDLVLSSGLWNYEHPVGVDSLVFLSDTCYCSAVDLDFALCATTLKWDTDGNELAYHVLDSEGRSQVVDVGGDEFGSYYVSGTIDFSLDPPLFNNEAVESGTFLLKFGPNGEEEWIYGLSDQLESWNSDLMWFISGSEDEVWIDVMHDSNEIVTEDGVVVFDEPLDNLNAYSLIHVLDAETGSLDTLDLFGHLYPISPIELNAQGQPYALANIVLGFTHSFPPYTFEPIQDNSELLILSKEILGFYNPPLLLDANFNTIDNIASEKLYLYLSNNQEPVSFGFGGNDYNTQTHHCIAIIDQVTSTKVESGLDNDVNVFPNPNAGLVNINAPFPVKEVLIYSTQGELLLEKDIDNLTSLQLEHALAPGCYTMLVSGDGIQAARTLIIHY